MGEVSQNKVAIVSGAVQGIGEAVVRALLAKGWNIGALDLVDDLGAALVKEFPQNVIYVNCDMSNYQQQAAAFTQVWQKWGRLDAFCSNAGVDEQSQIYKLNYRGKDEIPPEPNFKPTRVSFFGFMYGVQLAVHFMRKNAVPGGAIVGTSSTVSVHPTPTVPEHAASKAAMNAFAKATAPFLKLRENITINTVLPGIVPTRSIPLAMQQEFDRFITPIETVVKAYITLLEDPSRYGQALELFKDLIVPVPDQPLPHPDVALSLETYEGLFLKYHGEVSGLPDAHPIK